MRTSIVVAVVLLSACAGQKGEPGPAGAQGAKGERGDVGPAGERGADGAAIAGARIVVWVDANGAVVGPESLFVDDAGVQWPLDRETGEVDLGVPLALRFGAVDCSGAPMVQVPPPRRAFTAGTDGGVYVRPNDSLRAEVVDVHTQPNGSAACLEAGPLAVMPLSELRSVAAPSSPFTGPLHVEWR